MPQRHNLTVIFVSCSFSVLLTSRKVPQDGVTRGEERIWAMPHSLMLGDGRRREKGKEESRQEGRMSRREEGTLTSFILTLSGNRFVCMWGPQFSVLSIKSLCHGIVRSTVLSRWMLKSSPLSFYTPPFPCLPLNRWCHRKAGRMKIVNFVWTAQIRPHTAEFPTNIIAV